MKNQQRPAKSRPAAENYDELLSQERIVSLSKRLMETSGLESVTMRRLAEELKVTPMALYHHVANKQALLALVSDAVIGTVNYPGHDAGPWYERVRQGILTVYQEINRFPGLGQHMLGANQFSPNGVVKMRRSVETLMEAGFDEDEALAGLYLLLTYMGGDMLTKGGAQRNHAQPIFSLEEDGEVSLHPSKNSKETPNKFPLK